MARQSFEITKTRRLMRIHERARAHGDRFQIPEARLNFIHLPLPITMPSEERALLIRLLWSGVSRNAGRRTILAVLLRRSARLNLSPDEIASAAFRWLRHASWFDYYVIWQSNHHRLAKSSGLRRHSFFRVLYRDVALTATSCFPSICLAWPDKVICVDFRAPVMMTW